MNNYGRSVRYILHKNGCYFVKHGKGDHDLWYSPLTNRKVTVDGKIPGQHMANEVLKQAGLKKTF